MSEKGADRAGLTLALSAMVAALGFAVGFVLIGLSYFVK